MAKGKKDKTMAELTEGYETFIKGKKVKATGKHAFAKTIKKAAIPKPKYGSK